MGLFRFLHRWPAIVPAGSDMEGAVPLLDDRDRELEDYLADVAGAAGNTVITYATGGTVIPFGKTFHEAPVVVANIEQPVGTDPYAVYVHDVTTTGWKVVIYDGSGSEAGAGSYRVYWLARPAGG